MKDCSSLKKWSAFLWCLQFIDLRPQGTLWYRESFAHFPPYTLSCVCFVILSYSNIWRQIHIYIYIHETDNHPVHPCANQTRHDYLCSYTSEFLNCLCKVVPETKVHQQKVPLAAVIANKLMILPAQLSDIVGFMFFHIPILEKALKYRPDLCLFLHKNKMNEQSLFCLRPSKI